MSGLGNPGKALQACCSKLEVAYSGVWSMDDGRTPYPCSIFSLHFRPSSTFSSSSLNHHGILSTTTSPSSLEHYGSLHDKARLIQANFVLDAFFRNDLQYLRCPIQRLDSSREGQLDLRGTLGSRWLKNWD